MANEIFDALPTYAGSFALDDTTMVFSTGDGKDPGLGQLVQTLTVMYARPVQRHWEIGTRKVYFVIGRAQGQMAVQRLAAPNAIAVKFLIDFSSSCNIQNRVLTFGQGNSCQAGIGAGDQASYSMTSVIIDSLSMAISVGAVAITQSVSMQFIGMHLSQTAGGGTTDQANIGNLAPSA